MRLNNFAADMDSEIQQQGELFVTPPKGYPELKKTAIQLVKKYIDDLKKMKADPKYKDAVRIDPQELKKYKNIKGQEVGKKDLGYKRKYKGEDSFEKWADNVVKEYDTTTEGTWKAPKTAEDFRDIVKLMKEPIPVGVDGDNAQGIVYDHIGDDSLMDDLYELSQTKGPEADARPIIKKYAQMFMRSAEMSESGIMYRAGVKKYGKDGMKKIQSAAGSGASAEEIGAIKDKYNKKKTDEYSMMAVGMNPKPTKTGRDSKIGVKTYPKPKDAKEPYFKKPKK
jgi:hypothetical protein